MAFSQKLFTSLHNYTDPDTRIGELNRIWYDSVGNVFRIQLDKVTPGGTIIGGSGGSGGYTLPTASTTTLGGVKIDGNTITINNGIIQANYTQYTLPTASQTTLGGVKVDGTTITINGSGVISSVGTGTVVFKGTWNASTNSPQLSATMAGAELAQSGWEYLVSTTGTVDIGQGPQTFYAGDLVIYDGVKWNDIPGNAGSVVSFNTRTGAVTLTSTDVTTALGYTPIQRSSLSVQTASASGGGALSYNNTNGVFTFTPGSVTDVTSVDNTVQISTNGSGVHDLSIATSLSTIDKVFAYVTNDDSVTIHKGDPVYLYRATGNRPSVIQAKNTSDAYSAKTLGLASQDIAPGTPGWVQTQGVLTGVDTSAFAEGDTLYLSATAGVLTNVKPYAPNHLVYIGVVVRANQGQGQIYIRPQNGYELDEIHDVDVGHTRAKATGQTIVWNGTRSVWENNSYSYNDLTNTPTIPTTVTVNGTSITLNSSGTITAAAGTLTGTTLNSSVVTSSLTSVGSLNGLTINSTNGGTFFTISAPSRPASGQQTWTFWTNTNLGGPNSYIQFPDSSVQTTAYTGNAATVTNGVYTTDTGTVTNTMLAGSIANSKLSNSSVTINGTSIALGDTVTVTAAAGTLTGTTLNSSVVTSSLTSVGTLGSLTVQGGSGTYYAARFKGSTGGDQFAIGLSSTAGYGAGNDVLNSAGTAYAPYTISASQMTFKVGSSVPATVMSFDTSGNATISNTLAVNNATTVTYTPGSTTGSAITAVGKDTQGGTGYFDFLKATNTTSGVTNGSKTFRLNSTGTIEIINSAYSATLMSLSNAGFMSVSAGYQVAGKQAVNGPAFRAYVSTAQTLSSGSQLTVTFGAENFDTDNCFTNNTFTPTLEGYYQFNATVRISGGSGTGEVMLVLYKNANEYARGTNESGTEQGANWYSMQVSDIAYANGTTDSFHVRIQQTSGSNKDTTAGSTISYFSGCMIRGA